MSDVNLNLLFERCIHAMRGCADGGTTNYSASESKTTSEGTPAPYSPLLADEFHYRREFRKARTVEDKRTVIDLVIKAIRSTTVGNKSKVEYKSGTKEWRIAIAHDLRGMEAIVEWYGVTRQTVYDCRRKYGTENVRRAA